MANDNLRSHKVKMLTQNASPETSSSRRSSRETSSSKQTKEIPSSTRRSKRLEKSKPSESPPIRKSKRNQEQMTTTPMKRYDRRFKHTSVDSSGTKKLVEEPASSSIKSKNEKVNRSLKMDSNEDKKQENQGLDGGGRKRKRVSISVDKALSRSQPKRTEAGHDNDKESEDGSSQAASSSNRDVENSKNTDSGSESVEDKGDDDVEECSDRTGEESTLKASETVTQCSTSNSSLTNFSVEEINDHVEVEESPNSKKVEGVTLDAVQELSNDRFVDLEQVDHVGSPSGKSLHGESIEKGSVIPICGNLSSKRETPTQKTDPDVCTDIKEFWVPVQISNVQLEQYCSLLITNAMALSSCSKSDTVGALHDILVSIRKCCDHPYIVDQSLQGALTKDLELAKFLEVGIQASGKLQFLDLILPEMRKRELRVLILFQPLSGTGKDSTSIGDILDDFVRQRFGEDSYERVDAIITSPSKRQVALNNFNNKEMGRFIFLLDYRACLPSIKLSSVDTIIIFDSDWNPANDLRALQKIAIASQPEKVKIFRLYTSWTLEEKILKLSENRGLQNLSRSTCDALLIWGAAYLFSKLTEFHHANILPEEGLWNELMEEFLNLISDKHYKAKLIITRAQQSCGNLPLPNELPDGEQPHTFWRKLLVGRDPCWKYLTTSTPRQRKRPQFYDSLEKPNASSDDVGRKRKKIVPVTEKGEIKEACTVISSDESQLSPGDSISCAATCNETSFRHLLKLNISELCRVLKLSDEVKKMVENFLEYVIENYQVNKEPANTLQAFLISLCWIGSSFLKKKLDRKQTLAIARKRLNFTCEEEETNSVYLKLEQAKEMFLLHTKNQKKTSVSKEMNPDVVKVEALDSPEDQYVTISPDTSDVPEDQNDSPDLNNNSNSPPAPASQEKVPQPLVSPPSDQPVPTNSVEIHIDSIQDNPLQTKDAEKVDQIIPEMPPIEQQHEAPPQVLETTADDPNHIALQNWPNLLNLQESEIYNRGPTRMPSCSDPLQVELEKLSALNNTVNNFYEAIKLKLKSDYEKERAEMLARINRKYEDKSQKAEMAFHSKKNEIDINFNKVVKNKILAEAFRSKCRDLNPFDHSQIQREMQHLNQFHGQPSPGQSSGSKQVNKLHSTPQIVHQSANLFSHTPTRPPPSNPSNPITPSPPPRPPPSNISTTTTPTRPPPNITSSKPPPTISPITPSTTRPPTQMNPSSTPNRTPPHMNPSSTPNRTPPHMNPLNTPSKPPPNITSTTPSLRNPNPRVTGEIRAPAPHIRPFKPSTSVSPRDHASHRVILGQHTSSSLPPSSTTFSHTPAKPPLPPSSQTPPSFPTIHNSHPTQPVAPPPPTSSQMPTNHNSHPTQPPLPSSSQMPPSFPTSINGHPTQPVAPPPPPPSQTPTNDNSRPAQSVAPPSIQLPSEQHPPVTSSSSLPPMPSVPILHTGLYGSGRFMELLMDVDKEAGFHQTDNVLPSQCEVLEPNVFGACGDADLVCLSDDD